MRVLRILVILGNIGLFGMFIYLAISEGGIYGKFWLIFFAVLSFFILNIYFIISKNSDKEIYLEKIEKIFKGFKSDWIKENWFKAGLLILGLIIAYSFYHTLVIRPSIERERKDAELAKEELTEEQDRLNEEARKEQLKLNLDSCLADAGEQYSNNWFGECKTRGLISQWCIKAQPLDFKSYLKENNLTTEEYAEQRNLDINDKLATWSDYLKRKEDCSCSLPRYNADRLDVGLKDDKDNCYKLYPQN